MNHVITRTPRPSTTEHANGRPAMFVHVFNAVVSLLGVSTIFWLVGLMVPGGLTLPEGNNWAAGIGAGLIVAGCWPVHVFITRCIINRIGLLLFEAIGIIITASCLIGTSAFLMIRAGSPDADGAWIFGVMGLAMITWYPVGVLRMLAIIAACAGLTATGMFIWAVHLWNLDLAAKAGGTALVAGLAYKIFAADIPASLRIIRMQLVREVKAVTGPLLLCALISLMIGAILLHYLLTAAHIPGWAAVLGWVAVLTLAVLSFYAVVLLPFRLLASLYPGTPSPGLADVANQKVHGDAGYASAPEIDAALRDQDHGGLAPPHFRD